MSNNKGKETEGITAAEKKAVIIKLTLLVVVSAVIFAIYRVLMTSSLFPIVLGTYLTVLTALIAVYLIYNRGFIRKNVTVEMLPDEWDEQRKLEYVEDGKMRVKRSSWILIFIMAFAFTLVFELFELYFLPALESVLDSISI